MDELNLPTISGIRKIVEPLYERLKSLEMTLANGLKDSKMAKCHNKYYRNSDLKEMFGLSSNTIIKYRETGTLPYTKLGDVYLYEVYLVEQILKKNNVCLNC